MLDQFFASAGGRALAAPTSTAAAAAAGPAAAEPGTCVAGDAAASAGWQSVNAEGSESLSSHVCAVSIFAAKGGAVFPCVCASGQTVSEQGSGS